MSESDQLAGGDAIQWPTRPGPETPNQRYVRELEARAKALASQFNAYVTAAEPERQELEARAEEAERALERIREAWSKSWDCSADPGHRLMNEALAPSRPSATEEEKT